MKGYFIYQIFLEKYVAECTGKDLEDLKKVTMRVAERLNRNMDAGIDCQFYMNGVVAVIQDESHSLLPNLCMNQLEKELDLVLTDEYQSSFIYADYVVPEDHVEMMLYRGCLQYEHSFIAPNSRRALEIGNKTLHPHSASEEVVEILTQLYECVMKGEFEQARILYSKIHSEYQNETYQNQYRMRYRLGMMNLLYQLNTYTEDEGEQLGTLLFTMPMSRTWHRFMISEMYRVCQVRSGHKDSKRKASFLQKVRMYIDKEISNPELNLKMAAEAFDLTPSYFSSLFKKNMQMNFLSYVENKRMNIGYALLIQGDITVEKVAAACGYENTSTFRRNFKEYYGRNPVDVLNGERRR